jgi:hypothetical protein
MTGVPRPDISDILPGQIWELLFQQTLQFSTYQVNRLRWRGDTDGILPDGYDPNSIAAQAISDFLLNQNPNLTLSLNFNPPDTCKERPQALDTIQYEINRLVLKHVTRLHHRKENFILYNAEDLALVPDMDAEFVSALDLIPGPDIQPDEALIRKESDIEFHQLKRRFAAVLRDRPLIHLLELRCNGVSKPRALAAHLKLGVRTIYNLRVRLQRAWFRFAPGGVTRK